MKHATASRLSTLSFALSALALVTSIAGGCSRDAEDAVTNSEAPSSAIDPESARGTARPASPAASPATGAAGQPTTPAEEKAESSTEATAQTPKASAAEPATGGALRIKRLVVTHAVEEREPAKAEALIAGSPIYAFLELANRGDAAETVVITFERDGTKPVGHVELEVPAEMSRWRTWGKTALIQEPGTWSAVIKSKDGRELGRQAFEVQGA